MSSDTPKNYGLVARGAPVKPPLFKMPRTMVMSEPDKAHGGGVTVMGRAHTDNYGSYYQGKQKAEKFDSGLDEVTQRWNVDAPITPVSCTEDERGILSEYVYQPKAKTVEPPSSLKSKPKVESHTDISDSAIEMSESSTGANKKAEVDSVILRTVHELFVEDEDGER